MHKQGGKVALNNFYRVFLGKRQGQQIWIVDGARVVRHLYPPFVMGGNDQRYRFNPPDDIWIDNRIGGIELEYTIGHELIERKLMRTKGMTYDRAHNQGLDLEKRMRAKDARMSAARLNTLDAEVAAVYRSFYRTENGVDVWFVDGPKVRETLDGDFCFVACDKVYSFIPENEIWLDATMTCEHVHYCMVHEFERRRLIAAGHRGSSYEGALDRQIKEYAVQEDLATKHEELLEKVSYGDRFRGVKVKPKKKRRGKKKDWS